MGYTGILSTKTLRCMAKADRQAQGKAGILPEEVTAKQELEAERDLQTNMVGILNQRGLFFFHPPMKRTKGIPEGWPDFTIWFLGGHCILVEAKTLTGKLSKEQEKLHGDYWQKTGFEVFVVRELKEFCELLDREGAK